MDFCQVLAQNLAFMPTYTLRLKSTESFINETDPWSSVTAIVEKKYYQSHWGPETVWLPTFFKVSFMFSRINKYFPVWNNLWVCKRFWVLVHPPNMTVHESFSAICAFIINYWKDPLITFPFSLTSGELCVQRADLSSRAQFHRKGLV